MSELVEPGASSAFPVTLQTTDGETMELSCAPEQSVLSAAEAAGFSLPSLCDQGTCGSCHATATSGEYRLDEHSERALPADEEMRGGVLLCCTYPRGPLAVDLPYDRSRIIVGAVPQRRATIREIDYIGRDTVRLELALQPDDELGVGCQFDAGQFVELEVPGADLKRAYSLSNIGNWDGVLEFLIKLRPGGRFSTYLRDVARPGDELVAHGPQGAFGLRETGMRPRWFIGGGTGLAPLLSMVRRMADWQDPQPALLVFGVNEPADVFGIDQLEDVAARLPGFSYDVCAWKPDADWTGRTGTPVDVVADELRLVRETPDIYVCGPPSLVDAIGELAAAHGISEDHVFRERYLPT